MHKGISSCSSIADASEKGQRKQSVSVANIVLHYNILNVLKFCKFEKKIMLVLELLSS